MGERVSLVYWLGDIGVWGVGAFKLAFFVEGIEHSNPGIEEFCYWRTSYYK